MYAISRLLTTVVLTLTAFPASAKALTQAHEPTLPDGAAEAPPQVALGWLPGDGALLHHVFLSTDFDDVNGGSLHAWKACRPDASYNARTLLLGRTYFWRVDEVGSTACAPGRVWSFTVKEALDLDDMESYSNTTDYMFDTWLDGAGDVNGVGGNGTGAIVDLSVSITHQGRQAMRYAYNNTGLNRRRTYSEASRTFDTPQNWTDNDEKAIELWFCGSAHNDIEPMYLALDDGSVAAVSVYGDNSEGPNDIEKEQWQQWNIDLAQFANAGVNLSNIIGVAIGFGDSNNPSVGGVGVVYFDDISLRPTTCVVAYGPAADLSGNCVVDLPDIALMAADWLAADNLPADLNHDGIVDFGDYAFLTQSWLAMNLWP
ncbi:MAG TPA: hypothetical protein VMX13_02790 [Sedimentisphaerales bacterium]|nr:hypothetical protein [Sedimentisphaerales bacterium]